MTLTPRTFLIVCPLLFLAGFVDSIAGGGGLISLPAYLFAGLPVHTAIGTNKLSSACGTSLTTIRFIRNGLVRWKLALPGVAAAMIGSWCGSRLSLVTDERVIRGILFAVLPVAAFIVLNRKLFPDREEEQTEITHRVLRICTLAALIVGFYDGFYGPGTGTFLIIAFTVFARLGLRPGQGDQSDHQHHLTYGFPVGRHGADPSGSGGGGVQHAGQLRGIRPRSEQGRQDHPAHHPGGAGAAARQAADRVTVDFAYIL